MSNPAQLCAGENGQLSCAEGTPSGEETSHCHRHLSKIIPEDMSVRPNK